MLLCIYHWTSWCHIYIWSCPQMNLWQLVSAAIRFIKTSTQLFRGADFIYIYLMNRLTNSNTRHLEKHTFTTFGCDGPASASASCLFTYLLLVFNFTSCRSDNETLARNPTPKRNLTFINTFKIAHVLGSKQITFGQFRFMNAAVTWPERAQLCSLMITKNLFRLQHSVHICHITL